MKLRFMTYNIMHRAESARRRKYFYCASDILDSGTRLKKVAEEVRKLSPDVIALQEVDQHALDFFSHELSSTGLECALSLLNLRLPSKDGCAIFARKDKFETIKTHSFRFNDILPTYFGQSVVAGGGSAEAQMFFREIYEKLNLGLVATLACRQSGLHVNVATTHLFWDPKIPDLKLLQAYLLGRELHKYRQSNPAPIILGGDFNSVPLVDGNQQSEYNQSPEQSNSAGSSSSSCASSSSLASGVYDLFTQGQVAQDHPDHPCARRKKMHGQVPMLRLPQRWRSAYKDVQGCEPKFTNYTAGFKGCLDYILMSSVEDVDVRASAALSLPTEDDLKKEIGLPSSVFPSDHLPLLAEFELTKQPLFAL